MYPVGAGPVSGARQLMVTVDPIWCATATPVGGWTDEVFATDVSEYTEYSLEIAARQGHMKYRTVSVYPQVDQQLNKAIELIATGQLPPKEAMAQAQATSIAELKRAGVAI